MTVKEKRYYSDFSDDFEQSANQDFALPQNYKWIKTEVLSRILSAVVYALAVIFSSIYCKFFLHMKVTGRENLKKVKGGYFIFGNHTQPIGDVFTPALCAFPKRIYTIVSTANYGIPVIGKILPYLGALPIKNSASGIKELNTAITKRLSDNHPIVVYPEAHVWEYCTLIRPYPYTSFKFPVKNDVPSFAMTVTYKKSKLFKKPTMQVFIDGPFYGAGNNLKEKAVNLHDTVFDTMKMRSSYSDCNYIEYIKK